MSTTDLPEPGPGADRLRQALLDASFTADGVLELLGATAYAALARGETVPAERAIRGDDGPRATLVRLFLLNRPVPAGPAETALPAGEALAGGWLRPGAGGGGTLRAAVDIRPYAGPDGEDWWIVSDAGCAVGGAAGLRTTAATGGRDVVLGAGGASSTLAQITVRTPVTRALDVGTGCGIQALHAARHATEVTATDVNPRALRMTRLTLALSGVPAADVREGSLFGPVEDDEPYDLIVSNPPFVISPPEPGERLTYRDGGLPGDELCRTLVRRSAAHLAPGGYCQLLANWQHVEGEDWRERVSSWVPPGCDAWIMQREEQDVAQYTELWLRDAGVHRDDQRRWEERYEAWLEEFAARRTRAVGFGWITLRRTDAEDRSVIVEDWPHAVEQPLGDEIRSHFERLDFLRRHDDASLLNRRFVLAENAVQEQIGRPGAEDPEYVVLRRRSGVMRATTLDTVGAGFAGSCDGTLPAGVIADAIAQLLAEDPVLLRDRIPPVLRALVEEGFLLPCTGD
ncbi:class I SAM-dependent methyltransferase [Streptomyces sodiiphilus]|uniref:Class I SAM-dependent methyltransferase n=1 Tax=Streptomyces sodiiphilus TaxID=226217 RepID=A0ABP5B0V9_9ACTN